MLNILNSVISLLSPEKRKEAKRRPRTVNLQKYKTTVIYEIRSINYPEIFYIGHTINKNTRFEEHKKEASDGKNNHLKSRYMRLIGVDNFTFKIIKRFSCNNRKEAEKVEMEYIKQLSPCMNTEFVSYEQKKINELKYIQFSKKVEFSVLYTFGKELLRSLKII